MRLSRVLVAIAATLVLPVSASALSADTSPFRGHGVESVPATTVPTDDSTPTTTLDNAFLPEDANIGDCVSALPRPECGSEARGGWHQTLVFVALFAGLSVIALRLVLAVVRRDRRSSAPERRST